MKFIRTALFVLFVTPLLTVPAHADRINRTVKAGTTTPVYRFFLLEDTSCVSARYARVTFTQPKNGTLTSKRTPFRPSKGQRCAGKLVKGITVYYTPKRGFRGIDSGKFGFNFARFDDGEGYNYHGVRANFNVR